MKRLQQRFYLLLGLLATVMLAPAHPEVASGQAVAALAPPTGPAQMRQPASFSSQPAMLVEDIHASGDSSPSDLTPLNDILYFVADDGGHGRELWRSDGTPEGTWLVKDINPGPTGAFSSPTASDWESQLTVAGELLYFIADDGVHGGELWRSDGTAEGTWLVADINPGVPESQPHWMTAVGDMLYLQANDGSGIDIWNSDGSPAGTSKVIDFENEQPMLTEMLGVNGKLFFTIYQMELWISDGTAQGTLQLVSADGISQLVDRRGVLYFVANRDDGNLVLWRSDGTPAGTHKVFDWWASVQVERNGLFYYTSCSGPSLPSDPPGDCWLWRSDLTAEGTQRIYTFSATMYSEQMPAHLTLVGDQLFWKVTHVFIPRYTDPSYSYSLWTMDQGLITRISDVESSALTSAGYQLAFAGKDNLQVELWHSDGTPAGTRMLDIAPGSRSSHPERLTVAGAYLYLTADDGVNGRELWRVPLSAFPPRPIWLPLVAAP